MHPVAASELPESYAKTLETIKSKLPAELASPKIGIICGSGLSGLASTLEEKIEIPYDDLEGFGKSTVMGHKSALAFGYLGERKVPVVAMLGRFHPYEGHSMASVVYPVRVLALLGVKQLIITNASGGLNRDIPVGTIVVIQDHLALPNLTGHLNPLLGPVLAPPFHTRFVPLSTAYSFNLRKLVFRAAHQLNFPSSYLTEGTYAWVSGPTYESSAEGRFLRSAGADVVGMSTVPEVVAARQAGVEVLVLSLVTNPVIIPDSYRSARAEVEAEIAGVPLPPYKAEEVSHEEVLEIGRMRGDDMRRLVEKVVDLTE
ncbi:hypothetical protein FRC02_008645 [Tulasnella sp. 418]|nr:hypothetical protein FRC02_008645 [Tulasnella sp. 418]